jgi:hypothetical protein
VSLETVVIILFISPFLIGALSVFFSGSNTVTPIIVDYRPSQSVQTAQEKAAEHGNEFLDKSKTPPATESETPTASETEKPSVTECPNQDQDTPKLEESPDAMEILQEIPAGEENVARPTQYEVSEIPEELDKSLNDLFKAIDGRTEEETTQPIAVAESSEPTSEPTQDVHLYYDVPDEYGAPAASYEEFESSLETIDEMLEHIQEGDKQQGAVIYNFPFGESLPIPPREYVALQQKYGDEVVSRVTTTPGKGGTGDYDCMIGRVMQKYNLTVLQYGDHYIPLKGMDNEEGVFLVEGMFVKPDLFFVRNYTELSERTTSIGRAAEN